MSAKIAKVELVLYSPRVLGRFELNGEFFNSLFTLGIRRPDGRTDNHIGLPLRINKILFAFFAGAMNRGPSCSFFYCLSPVP